MCVCENSHIVCGKTMNMKMSMKGTKKMRGMMCQSPGATAVCMSMGDPRSVILPRTRPDRTLVERARLLNNSNYTRLVERRHFPSSTNSSTKRSSSSVRELQLQPKAPAAQLVPPVVSSSNNQIFQVVVMRVSLHCQGCAGKVKKHLSKMEGVTSFSIDLESKRVTVRGHVTPVGVLESISKVKKAEFWP